MNKTVHGIIQMVAVGMALAVASKSAIPPHYRELYDAGIAFVQAALALYNHVTPAK